MTRDDVLNHSTAAFAQTKDANEKNTAKAHNEAASHHRIASEAASVTGDDGLKNIHANMADQHDAAANNSQAAASNNVQPPAAKPAEPAAATPPNPVTTPVDPDALVSKVAATDAGGKEGIAAGGPGSGRPRGNDMAKDNPDRWQNHHYANNITEEGKYQPGRTKMQYVASRSDVIHHDLNPDEAEKIVKEHNGALEKGAAKASASKISPAQFTAICSTKAASRTAAKPELQASLAGGGFSLNDLQTNVRTAISTLPMLNAPANGAGTPGCGCWVCDVVAPDGGDDNWTAIVNGADGKLYAVDFDADDSGNVTVAGTPQVVEKSSEYDYVNDIMVFATESASKGGKKGLDAGGPGSGRHPSDYDLAKSDETAMKSSNKAVSATKQADAASDTANSTGTKEDHAKAEDLHKQAIDLHRAAQVAHSNSAVNYAKAGKDAQFENHLNQALSHKNMVANHSESFMKHSLHAGNAGGKTGLQAASGVPEADPTRTSKLADMATEAAGQMTDQATSDPSPTTHEEASYAHQGAYEAHKSAYENLMKAGAMDDDSDDARQKVNHHFAKMQEHQDAKNFHDSQVGETQARQANPEAYRELNASIGRAIEAGDYPGHPFHGNQYGAGAGGSMAGKASAKAHMATKNAKSAAQHVTAAKAHRKAAMLQAKKGNQQTADYHNLMGQYHETAAKEISGGEPHMPNATAAATKEAAKATVKTVKEDKPELHEAAEKAHNVAKLANRAAGNHEKAAKHGEMAEKHHGIGRIPSLGGEKHKKKKDGEHKASAAIKTMKKSKITAAIEAADKLPKGTNPAELSINADAMTKSAKQATEAATNIGTRDAHSKAADMHDKAYAAHMGAYAAHAKAGSDDTILDKHMRAMAMHKDDGNDCIAQAEGMDSDAATEARAIRAINKELMAAGKNPGIAEVVAGAVVKLGAKVTEATVIAALAAGDGADECYQEGADAAEAAENPYDEDEDPEDYQAWESGYESTHDTDDEMDGKNAAGKSGLDASARAVPLECASATGTKFQSGVTEDGTLMYMPSGLHTITPSQGGRPVTVTLLIDASAAQAAEDQRVALTAKGKKPFFSIQHGTEIAGFWPTKFYWGTKMDATGKYAEGVWADGEWTASGKDARDGKDFRTFSPTFHVDSIRNDTTNPAKVICQYEARANMGALENDPAFQSMSPLWARNAYKGVAATLGVNREMVKACHDALSADGGQPSLTDMISMFARNGLNVTEDTLIRYL